MKILILSMSMLGSISGAAFAQVSCNKPTAPMCLTGWNTFENDLSFNNCAADMDRYQADVFRYSDCLKSWAADAIEDAKAKNQIALDEYRQAVEFWNCKAASPDAHC